MVMNRRDGWTLWPTILAALIGGTVAIWAAGALIGGTR